MSCIVMMYSVYCMSTMHVPVPCTSRYTVILIFYFVCMLQVDLCREFVFRNSKQHYNGVPVMASNMDTVGTFEMALALGQVRPKL